MYSYVEKVGLADQDIKDIANDVSSTSVVLEVFRENLKLDKQLGICKPEFYEVTSRNIKDCDDAFTKIDETLQKSVKAIKDAPLSEAGNDPVYELRTREKFLWPFKETRIEKMRSNLERLKANLNLKMQVMAYAREMHERQIAQK